MSKDTLFDFRFFKNVLDFFKIVTKTLKNDFEIETIEVVVKKLLFLQAIK
jgi:hypothetical protein